MKVLIAPFILQPREDSHFFLVSNLIQILHKDGHQVAVSCDESNGFKDVSLYHCPSVRRHIFPLLETGMSYEEWMFRQGALDKNTILEDLEGLHEAIQSFQPDMILVMDRPAAVAIAKQCNIPCYVFVHPAMYRNIQFPAKCMHGLNEALSTWKMEQEINLKSLYSKAMRRIAFGSMRLSAFRDRNAISRIGMMSIENKPIHRTNLVFICLSDTTRRPRAIQKSIREAFQGAPYVVYVYLPGVSPHVEGNVHYLKRPTDQYVPEASAVIHDGNDYFFHQAIHYGIPQLIITGHTYKRAYNAMLCSRNRVGAYLFEENLSVATLYEGYRKILCDDVYYETVNAMKKEVQLYGDLSQVIDFMYIDLIMKND